MNHNQKLGVNGEGIAQKYLERKGYKLLAKNFRQAKVELDLVFEFENEIIFVEVKTRSSEEWALPEKAVGKTKQKNIKLAAELFLELHQLEKSVRFDIIAVVKIETGFEIEHFEDAFYPFDAL